MGVRAAGAVPCPWNSAGAKGVVCILSLDTPLCGSPDSTEPQKTIGQGKGEGE